ncbi:MAG: hypothetical protein N3A72_09465 [bacterium]|nr:hypothetical protein [bacterium]
MADCQYYSEQIMNTSEGQVKQVFCASPNWALLSVTRIDLGCPSYRLDWTKRTSQLSTPEIKPVQPKPQPEESTAAILPRKPQATAPSKPTLSKVKNRNNDQPNAPDSLKPKPRQKPTPDFAPPVSPKPEPEHVPTKAFSRMKDLPPPEEIVRRFIESWNKQDFAAEYQCLSQTLPLPPLGDYIQSRQSIYQALSQQIGKGTPPLQQVEIKKVEFRPGGVYIECLRKDILGKEEKHYLQEFLLRREEGGWKITHVHSKRLRTT